MPPKPDLESLPTELKLRVADMCAIQDYRCSQTLTGISNALDVIDDELDDELDSSARFWEEQRERRAFDSLSQLFQVSRSWHRVVATIRFRSIDAAKQCNKGFLLGIGPRYGNLVESLDAYAFEHFFEASAADFLTALPMLTNLKTVSLGSTRALARKFDAEGDSQAWGGFDSVPYVESAISRVLARVSSVKLSIGGLHDTLKLCAGPSITKLDILLEHPDDFVPLNRALQSLPALAVLRIAFDRVRDDFGRSFWPHHGLPEIYGPPALRHLHVDMHEYSPALVSVISRLGQAVTRLSLKYHTLPPLAGPVFPDGTCWPNVHTL